MIGENVQIQAHDTRMLHKFSFVATWKLGKLHFGCVAVLVLENNGNSVGLLSGEKE